MPAASHSAFLGRSRFASLDGLRCLSILPVIWHHSTPRQLEGVLGRGPLGVHLFFAISGFLITTLLLRERRASGRISLSGFYARRSLRIFPLYYAVLALYALRTGLFLPESAMRSHFFASLPYYASYTGNWLVDYGVPHPVIFGFSWSLATEEQFYLLWPPVLAWAASRRSPALFMFGLFVLDQVAERGAFAPLIGTSGVLLNVVTSISAPICLGSLAALALDDPRGHRAAAAVLGWRGSAPLSALVLALLVWLDAAPLLAIHLAMVALVVSVCLRADHGLGGLLDARVPAFIGSVSYGMYLLHVSVITSLRWALPGAGAPVVFVLASALTLGLAAGSFRWFETPFLRLRERFRPRPRAGREPRSQVAV